MRGVGAEAGLLGQHPGHLIMRDYFAIPMIERVITPNIKMYNAKDASIATLRQEGHTGLLPFACSSERTGFNPGSAQA